MNKGPAVIVSLIIAAAAHLRIHWSTNAPPISRWWNAPQQSLLRHELAWFGRFLRSPKGIALILLQVFVQWGITALSSSMAFRLTRNLPPFRWLSNQGLFAGFAVLCVDYTLYGLLRYGPWMYLFHKRVLARLREASRDQLRVLPVSGKDLWPALVMTPLLWACVINPLCLLAVKGVQRVVFLLTEFQGYSGSALAFYLGEIDYFITPIFRIASGMAFTILVTLLIVRRPTVERFALCVPLLLFVMEYVMAPLSWAFYHLRASLDPSMQNDVSQWAFSIAKQATQGAIWLVVAVLALRFLRRRRGVECFSSDMELTSVTIKGNT